MCPTDLKEAVTSIIFAAPRCADIPELKDISKHFTAKYGKEFVNAAIELRPDSGVGRTLVEKLSAKAPDGPAKVKILTAIAGENSIKWEPSWFEDKEPEPPLPKVCNIDKGNQVSMGIAPNLQGASSFEPREEVTSSRIHGFASNHQTAPSFEPMYGVSSTVHDAARSERNSLNLDSLDARYGDKPITAYSDSYAGPPDTEFESVRSFSSSACDDDAHFVGKPINNKVFKDAADAANAAARSAEEASRAAKAAAELAGHGKNLSRTDSGADFDYAHNRADLGHKGAAVREDPMERKLIDSPPPERKSRMEEGMRKDDNRTDKAYAAVSEEPLKEDLTALHIRHDSFKQRSPRIQAERKEKGRTNEGSPNKEDYQTMEEHKDEFPCGTDSQWTHHPPSDTRSKSRSQNGLADYIETSSYSNHQEEFVENPFFEAVGQTQNSSSGSQYVDLGEDYGVHPNFNVPKFDDEHNEDSFAVFSERYALKEDREMQEPLHHVDAQFSALYSQKDDVFSYSEQERYGIKPTRVSSLGMKHGEQYTGKGHERTDTSAGAVFDDYGSDDDADTVIVSKEDMQSSTFYNPSASDSPLNSSPDRSRSTIRQERQSFSSSKNLFQPELSEISKSPLWSEPDKPLPIKFDDLDDGEESNTRAFSEEWHKLGSTSTIRKSSRQKTSISDSESFDNHSFSSRQDEEEENQQTRTKLTSPEELPGLTYYHGSNAESISELNLKIRPRGRRNVDYSRPPYTIDPSTRSSSCPSYTSDPSTLTSSSGSSIHSLGAISKVNPPLEHLEPPNQSESTGRKHSSLSHYSAGYDPNANDDRYLGTGHVEPTGASLDIEQQGSLDKGPRETVPNKGVSVRPGFSRRTRAPQNSIAYSKPEFISSNEELLDTVESVPKKESSSAHSYTASERAELLRWAENKAADKPIHLQNFEVEEDAKPSAEKKRATNSADGSRSVSGSARSQRKSSERPRIDAEAYNQPIREPKTAVREENLRSSVEVKKPTDSKGGSTPPEPRSVEKAAFKDNSMKKPGHVHPNLPTDFDDFAERLKALHLDR